MADTLPPIVVALRATIGDFKAKMGEAAAETKSFGDKSKSNFDAVGQVGKVALAGIAGGALAIGGESLKMGISFQEATTRLVTGAGESDANLELVRQGILKMAPAVGQGPEALATAMFTVESAGMHGADGLAVMQAAAEGAKVGGADMTVVANGLTTAMTDYRLSSDQAATTTSKLVETVAHGKTTMAELSGSLSAVLPTAQAAGVGLDQVLGAMATMTGEGISAQQSAQDLSSTISSLSAPSAVMSKAMGQLGINSTDLSANMGKIGLTGTLQTLSDTITSQMGPDGLVLQDSLNQSKLAAGSAKTMIDSLPESLRSVATAYLNGTTTAGDFATAFKGQDSITADLGKQFKKTADQANGFSNQLKSGKGAAATYNAEMSQMTGGVTGLHVALALTNDNQATFDDNVKGIGEASAQADGHVKGWAETQADLGTKIAQAKAGVQAMGVSIGMALIPYVEDAISIGTEWAHYLGDHQDVLLAIAGVIGGALVTAIGVYVTNLTIAGVKSVIEFAKMVAGAAAWAADMTASAVLASADFVAAMIPMLASAVATGIGMVVAFWPIILAVGAIAIAAYELYTHWDTVWGFIKQIASDVWGFLRPIFSAIVDTGLALITTAVSDLETAWSAVWGAVTSATSAVWGVIQPILYDVVQLGLIPVKIEIALLKAAFEIGWALIKLVVRESWSVIKAVFDEVVDVGLAGIRLGLSLLSTVWNATWGAITAVASAAWNDVIHPIFETIVGVGMAGIRIGLQFLSDTWNTIWGGITSVVSSVWSFLSPIFNAVVSTGMGGIHAGLDALSSAWNAVWGSVMGAVSSAWNFIRPILDSIQSGIHDVINAVSSVTNVIGSISGGISGALNGIPGFAGGVDNFSGGTPTNKVASMLGSGRPVGNGGGGGGGVTNIVHVHVAGGIYGPGGEAALVDVVHDGLLRKQTRGSLGLAS
jgi:hypothetical protein